jgi:hypothetical protein
LGAKGMVSADATAAEKLTIAAASSAAKTVGRQLRRPRAWQLVVTSCLSLD